MMGIGLKLDFLSALSSQHECYLPALHKLISYACVLYNFLRMRIMILSSLDKRLLAGGDWNREADAYKNVRHHKMAGYIVAWILTLRAQ
jgi:hypothetical protein